MYNSSYIDENREFICTLVYITAKNSSIDLLVFALKNWANEI